MVGDKYFGTASCKKHDCRLPCTPPKYEQEHKEDSFPKFDTALNVFLWCFIFVLVLNLLYLLHLLYICSFSSISIHRVGQNHKYMVYIL